MESDRSFHIAESRTNMCEVNLDLIRSKGEKIIPHQTQSYEIKYLIL